MAKNFEKICRELSAECYADTARLIKNNGGIVAITQGEEQLIRFSDGDDDMEPVCAVKNHKDNIFILINPALDEWRVFKYGYYNPMAIASLNRMIRDNIGID